jgi:hypothetical protein
MGIDPDSDRGVFFDSDEHTLVHEWRRDQLRFLGVPEGLADSVADDVDWHMIADLVGRGYPPRLALEIAR